MKTEYITFEEFIESLHICRNFGYQLLKEKRVPGAKKLGKKWIIPTTALEEIMKATL